MCFAKQLQFYSGAMVRMMAIDRVDYEDDDGVFIALSLDTAERVVSREAGARVRQNFPETWLWMGNTTGYLNSAFPFHPA